MRRVVVVVPLLFVIVGCKQQQEEEPPAAPATPSVGRSVTKLKAPDDEVVPEQGAAPAEAPAEKRLYGGNGQPAYRDEHGRIRGPGGSIYMGRGPDCTDEIDHCLRDGVWFAAGNVTPGKLYRATPVFEFEGAWYSFREQKSEGETLFKTKVVERASELVPGQVVVWLIEESSGKKWLNSEHDALTSSRWEVGTIESVGTSTFKVKGWPSAIPVDTARVVVAQKKS